MSDESLRQVLVLVNPKSGLPKSFSWMRKAFDKHWDVEGVDLSYQFTQSADDAVSKVRRAVDRGLDTVMVVGGDGTVSSVGRALIGSDTALGVVPAGSGNGFARHFGIPLFYDRAIEALASADVNCIDVGVVNDRPFLVTCSMAWEAELVKSFDKLPVRGILPYVFAGVHEFIQYEPQRVTVELDSGEELDLPDPILFTIANLTEYGGGARVAPHAVADDGKLELIAALRQDLPLLIPNVAHLFDGTIREIPEIVARSFAGMTVKRQASSPIQVDGELVDAPASVAVSVMPQALRVLVPKTKVAGGGD